MCFDLTKQAQYIYQNPTYLMDQVTNPHLDIYAKVLRRLLFFYLILNKTVHREKLVLGFNL